MKLREFLAARFDARNRLGRYLTVAVVLCGVGIWALSALLDAVLDNATLVRWDLASAAAIHARVTPGGLRAFDIITYIGSPIAMTIVAVIGALVLIWKRWLTTLTAWIAAFAGSAVIERVIKYAVHRSRPEYAAQYLHNPSYSFPSGHAMGSFVGYAMIVYALRVHASFSSRGMLATRLGALALVILVGVSRIYLGVHYPSDVLGGWAAAAAWVGICTSAAAVGPLEGSAASS